MSLLEGKEIKIKRVTIHYLKTEEYDDGVYIRYGHGRWIQRDGYAEYEVDCLEEISELETHFKNRYRKNKHEKNEKLGKMQSSI